MSLKSIVFVVLMGAVLFVGGYFYLSPRPYFKSSDGISISQKGNVASEHARQVFIVKAGEIDGEASLVEVENEAQAQLMTSAEITSVTSPFRNAVAPYAGHITRVISCETIKHIKESTIPFKGAEGKVVAAVATERRLFGSCLKEDIQFAAAVFSGYDKAKKKLVTIRLYKHVENPSQVNDAQLDLDQMVHQILNGT